MERTQQNLTSARRWPALVSGLLLLIGPLPAYTQDQLVETIVSMKVSPNQCVAMTEGQTCYVDIELTWQSNEVGNYCLFSSMKAEALKCWTGASEGNYEQEIASKHNVLYSLKRNQNQQKHQSSDILVESEVEMAWVHKKRGKPTNWWRLF